MANNPTIISASLSDSDLKTSIDKLVKHVEEGTQKMAKSMDDAVEHMKKSLQSLGNININMGGASDGGASRRTKKNVEEEKSVKDTTVAYDKLAEAQEKIAKNSLKQSYARAQKIQTEDYDMAISKMERIQSLLNANRNTPFMSPSQVAASEQEVRRLTAAIQQMVAARQAATNEQHHNTQATRTSIASEVAATQTVITAQQQLKDKIVETGLSAQQTANEIIKMMHNQASTDGNSPITGVYQLTEALRQMRTAYFELNGAERESAIGVALKEDIKRTEQAIAIVQKYNESLIRKDGQNGNVLSNQSSVESLKHSLKDLTEQYNKLTVQEIRAGKGDEIIRKFQQVGRAAQVLQRQLNVPLTFADANNISVRTLDDMAYKMRQLQAYRQSIDLTKKGAAEEIKQVDNAVNQLQRDMDKYSNKAKDVLNTNNALARSWNYMKNRLAFYFTVGASTQFIKQLIDVRSQYEMNERALGILINSAERGTQIFQELSNMALVSPYTLIELSTAAKQLTAYDVAARDVVDTTRRLADMASAVGIPIERLTYALGQIRAYGYLNSRDNRMFANAGIPLVKQLADYYTELEGKLVSTAEVYDRIKKKAVGYNDVMQVINKMTDEGGKFFDFQAKMADTLKVRLANLTLAWNNMLNDIGKSNQGILTTTISGLKELFLHWKEFDKAIKRFATAGLLIVAFRTFGFLLNRTLIGLGVAVNKMALAEIAGKRLAVAIKSIVAASRALLTSPFTWISLGIFAFMDLRNAIWGANEAQIELNKSIRDGAKDNYENIGKFLEQYKDVRDSLYNPEKKGKDGSIIQPATTKDIKETEAKKVWDVLKEQIELTTKNADLYISRLLDIENVSERLRQGFTLLDEIQAVDAALKDLGDDTIKFSKDMSAWWNLGMLPDGTLENIDEYTAALKEARERFDDLAAAREKYEEINKKPVEDRTEEENRWFQSNERVIRKLGEESVQLQKNIDETNQSILNFINLKGWSGNTTKIEEVFSQVWNKFALDNNLSPEKAFAVRLKAAQAEYDAIQSALSGHIADENAALKKARDANERQDIASRLNVYKKDLDFLQSNTAESRVYWEDFLKWMGSQHKSEVTAMFKGMNTEQIKALDFQKGKYNDWVNQMVEKYAKEHKMGFKEVFGLLQNYVQSANQMSINIPLIIGTQEKKGVYDTLSEADTAADTAYQKIQRLNKRKAELEKKDAKTLTDLERQQYTELPAEIASAEKDLADAIAKGGHAKKEEKQKTKELTAAEKELQTTLKEEIQLIDKVRSAYKSLTKEGISHADAVDEAIHGYEKSVRHINAVLSKFGIEKLDLSKYAGISNPREILNMLEKQLNKLVNTSAAKPEVIQALEVKIKDIKLDVAKFDQKTVVDSLNNELGKLKDEYELAVDLEANPELGNIFADMIGLSTEQLSQLPKDFNAVVSKLQSIIDQRVKGFDLSKNLNKKNLENWLVTNGIEKDSGLEKALTAYVDYANDVRQKETKKQIEEWDKLLEKYAEYEYKRKQITEQYERELATARKKGANADIIRAITNRRDREYAQLDFNEFMKTPEWITATGDLANMSHKAIGTLIKDLEAYKAKARNLDPKQIKQLNSALSKLYKEQRKNNPFKAIGNMLDEAKNRMATFDEEIQKTQEDIDKLTREKNDLDFYGITDDETNSKLEKAIKRLAKLKETQKEVGQIDASDWVTSINETVAAVKQAISVFDDLAKAIGGVSGDSDVQKTFSVLEKAGSSAAIGAQIGGGWGAVIGGVVGAATSIISLIAGSGNEKINRQIEESERNVKKLEYTYLSLQRAIDKAYGSSVSGAKQAMAAAKKLELAELEHQLQLEKSRDAKDRDQDRIIELQKQIRELKYEIQDMYTEIVNDLLGQDVGSFAENLVSAMIEAFRKGEDYMLEFEKSFDKLIDNMILKSIMSRVVSSTLDSLWDSLEKRIKDRSSKEADDYAADIEEYERLQNMSQKELYRYVTKQLGVTHALTQEELDAYIEAARLRAEASKAALDAASQIDDSDISWLMAQVAEIAPQLSSQLYDAISKYYTFGQDTEKNLSALQQGIQGVTEDTAGSIEAYMNGVSQQVYLHSDLLTQIRDYVAAYDFDIQLSVMSQILMQLQASYQAQMAIQSTLSGWSNATGMAVRVEMI